MPNSFRCGYGGCDKTGVPSMENWGVSRDEEYHALVHMSPTRKARLLGRRQRPAVHTADPGGRGGANPAHRMAVETPAVRVDQSRDRQRDAAGLAGSAERRRGRAGEG